MSPSPSLGLHAPVDYERRLMDTNTRSTDCSVHCHQRTLLGNAGTADISHVFEIQRSLPQRRATGVPSPENITKQITRWQAKLQPLPCEKRRISIFTPVDQRRPRSDGYSLLLKTAPATIAE